jgi:hypothetical protein
MGPFQVCILNFMSQEWRAFKNKDIDISQSQCVFLLVTGPWKVNLLWEVQSPWGWVLSSCSLWFCPHEWAWVRQDGCRRWEVWLKSQGIRSNGFGKRNQLCLPIVPWQVLVSEVRVKMWYSDLLPENLAWGGWLASILQLLPLCTPHSWTCFPEGSRSLW